MGSSGNQSRENQGGKNKRKRKQRKKLGRNGKKEKNRKKLEKEKSIKVKKVAEEWKIWDEEEEAARLEVEAKKLVLEKFHR